MSAHQRARGAFSFLEIVEVGVGVGAWSWTVGGAWWLVEVEDGAWSDGDGDGNG